MLTKTVDGLPEYRQYLHSSKGNQLQDIWCYQPYTDGCLYESKECIDQDVRWVEKRSKTEKLGYPTQKPEGLLARIIQASSKKDDVVLDAYCGCGTTVTVAQLLQRRWIGIDITYQSIAVMLFRLENAFGQEILPTITQNGIPRDMASAEALANKQDDRVRKEFEKWAVLTYSNNRAIINEKKGADAGIDGTALFQTSSTDTARLVFQAKSGKVERGDIAKLRGDMAKANAELAVFITLRPVTAPMRQDAKAAGQYHHEMMGRSYDRIQIVTVQQILEEHKRLDLPMNVEVLRKAQSASRGSQMDFEME